MRKRFTIRVNASAFFLVLTFAIKSFTDAVYVAHDVNHFLVSMKYVTMLCGMVYALIKINGRKKSELLWRKDCISLLSVVVVFVFLSLIAMVFSPQSNSALLSETVKLVLGPVYAFFIINTLDQEEFHNCMKLILLFGFIGYVLEIGTGVFSIESLRSINIMDSYSPFESSYSAGTAITAATYFIFFDKEKRYTILSVLFVLLTFKRSLVLCVAVLFLVSRFKRNWDRPLHRAWTVVMVLFFTACTYVYMYLLDPTHADKFLRLFSTSARQFTMGRNLRYEYLLSHGFRSSGFGSSTVALGTNLEMDLIKLAIELSIVGLIYFLWVFTSVVHNHLYCYLLMFFDFFNMLTSHSLSGNFSWTLKFLVIAYILYSSDNEQYRTARAPFRFKKRERNDYGERDGYPGYGEKR